MISILMPLYNGIEFLGESTNSILRQTFDEWELLIGINGHEENSEVFHIANKYSSEKIKIFNLVDTVGKSSALNKLIKFADYDLICIIDVDDIWLPPKLEIQYRFINKYDIIGTNCSYFGESYITPPLIMGEIKEEIYKFNTIINSSVMINRKNRDIYWDNTWDGVEDYELWIRLFRNGWSFFNIPYRLVCHRIYKNSFYNTKNHELSKKLRRKMNIL